ncbi:MAG: vanadium-dependent haloperoxidase [Verrucomicrobia bacterium]|nr:MAG: vanadium-dependent haloperoxidase [Verrucomicrobiota bacterium]
MKRPGGRAASVWLWLLCASAAWAANPVLKWNALALDAIRFANTPPPAASRHLAILHVAIHDAIQGPDGTHAAYGSHTNPPPAFSREAALAAAANHVLRYSYPAFTPTFDAALEAQFVGIPEGTERTAGLAWGRRVALDILRERELDGATYGVEFRSSPGPGRWEPTPPLFQSALLPQWASLKPFVLARPDQFRPPGPTPLAGAEWARQFNQVKSLGATNGTARTREQTEIAWFWADGVGTESPPGRWNEVAQQLALARKLSTAETARLLALLNLALADAGIACWDAKYAHNYWRPIAAIRAAASDGNPDTAPDPQWRPLLVTPPFPEYPSGHSTFSGAAAALLEAYAGGDRFAFALRSDGLFGTERRYRRFSEAAQEAGMSRIYGGIHFLGANVDGLKTGRQIGTYVFRHALPRIR